MDKKTQKIDFPINELNLNKYCIGYKKNKNIYDLIGISNHIGNLILVIIMRIVKIV